MKAEGPAALQAIASLDEFVEKGQLECLNEDKEDVGGDVRGE